ncbi:MAG: archaeosortase A [Thermoplasmata archaeon]|nr:MAG: archaeosortase A [Thermoplasmata archaeon]
MDDNIKISIFFFGLPTILLIIGYILFPTPSKETHMILLIPLFSALSILAIGFLRRSHDLLIIGWILFALYWSTQPSILYIGEQGDIVNAIICILGVYILFYLAYHEWLSKIRGEDLSHLKWAAGVAIVAGFIYFTFDATPLAYYLIEIVASQSAWLLSIFTQPVYVEGDYIVYKLAHIHIIFACTAVQSMVLFVGMILPLNVDLKRKIIGLIVTVIPVYLLNLVRNALVLYLVGIKGGSFFFMAHNVIGKGGSLIALVILLFIVGRILPEIFDEIIALMDLPKRRGPIEDLVGKLISRGR